MLMTSAHVRASAAFIESRREGWFAVAAVFAVAVMVRLIGLGQRPLGYDELYHVLAARSWAVGAGTSIATGDYDRVRLYSEASGLCIRLFGWSVAAARLPSVLAGAVQVALVFRWTHLVANRRAAWISAALLCFSGAAIDLSQAARFYSWQVVTVWLAATQAYLLWEGDPSEGPLRRSVRLATAVAALTFGFYIQPTTAIALAAIAAAMIALHLDRVGLRSRGVWIGAGIGVAGALALTAIPAGRAAVAQAWASFREVAPWALADANRPTYYYAVLVGSYGWLLHLLPLAMLVAWRARPRPALFCIVLLGVALALQSLGGMKAERYVAYIDPFLLAIWGLALDSMTAPAIALMGAPFSRLRGFGRGLATGMAALIVGYFALIGIPTYRATAAQLALAAWGRVVAPGPDLAENEDVDWAPYRPALRRIAATSMLVTADDLRALYYLGGYDMLLNRSVMSDRTRNEFGVDPRTGGHGITTAASLSRLMRCYPSGTILVSNRRWRSQDVTAPVADYIEHATHPVPLPVAAHQRAFVWRGPDRRGEAECRLLRHAIGDHRSNGEGRLVTLAH